MLNTDPACKTEGNAVLDWVPESRQSFEGKKKSLVFPEDRRKCHFSVRGVIVQTPSQMQSDVNLQ